MRILLLEDEPAIRVAMKRGLKRAGHEVGVAANLSEAKELALEFRPEFLLSDLKLPDGTGLQLAEELAIPFILMSGYADFDDAVAAIRLGCVDFFTKPVAIDDITSRLEKLSVEERHGPSHVCIDPGHVAGALTVIEAQPHAFVQEELLVQRCVWADQDQARKEFDKLNLDDMHERQLAAELMQSTTAGDLVLNKSATRLRLWLSNAQALNAAGQEDRLQFLQTTADTYICRENGVYVEYVHAS